MPQKSFTLLPPLAGLNKKSAFKQKPPYSTPLCQNVRPVDALQQRERIGSRPGLRKSFYELLGSGNPINMISNINVMTPNSLRIWADWFDAHTVDSIWSLPSWIANLPTILELGGLISTYNTEAGAIRGAISPFAIASEYQIELFILPYLGSFWGRYQIFMSMNDATPAINTEGVIVEVTLTGSGAYTGRVVDITGGVGTITTATAGTLGSAIPCVLSTVRNGTNVKMYLNGTLLANVTVAAYTGKRVGFSMYSTVASGVCLVNGFRIQYNEGLYTEIERNILCVASNGYLYTNKTYVNNLTAVSSNLKLNTANLIMAQDRYQKLYIADFEEVKTKQTDGAISGTSLDSASVADWTAIGINIYDYVVVISSGTGPTLGTYTIATIAAGNLTLGSAPGDGTGISFYIQRAPKIYDPKTDALTLWTATAGKGTVPIGAFSVGLYRDRMVMILDHLFYMSRQGDPLDWDYFQTDVQRAVSSQLSEAGIVGQIIKSAVIFGDDYIIFFCASSTWRLRGDPTYGGQLDNVSNYVGCVDRKAYCLTPEGTLVFLSFDGIYALTGDGGSSPQPLSDNNLPTDLKEIDNRLFNVTMSFDVDYGGIHINLTPKSQGLSAHWWFDWANKSFWPVLLNVNHQASACFYYTENHSVLFGCKDGYIRCYDADSATDDGTAISSYCFYGPIRFSGNERDSGKLLELAADVALGSSNITYAIHIGDSYEGCINSTAFSTGTWALEGINPKDTPHAGGGCFGIKISNAESLPWAIENISGVIERSGVQRIL